MRAASDLLGDILRTAHATGLSREHADAIGQVIGRLVCERCERARVGRMADLAEIKLKLDAVISDLDALTDPRAQLSLGITPEVRERLLVDRAALVSIGGPTDPNAPAGG